jgi:hypothetical protein
MACDTFCPLGRDGRSSNRYVTDFSVGRSADWARLAAMVASAGNRSSSCGVHLVLFWLKRMGRPKES